MPKTSCWYQQARDEAIIHHAHRHRRKEKITGRKNTKTNTKMDKYQHKRILGAHLNNVLGAHQNNASQTQEGQLTSSRRLSPIIKTSFEGDIPSRVYTRQHICIYACETCDTLNLILYHISIYACETRDTWNLVLYSFFIFPFHLVYNYVITSRNIYINFSFFKLSWYQSHPNLAIFSFPPHTSSLASAKAESLCILPALLSLRILPGLNQGRVSHIQICPRQRCDPLLPSLGRDPLLAHPHLLYAC